jgi:hypothetical protein
MHRTAAAIVCTAGHLAGRPWCVNSGVKVKRMAADNGVSIVHVTTPGGKRSTVDRYRESVPMHMNDTLTIGE